MALCLDSGAILSALASRLFRNMYKNVAHVCELMRWPTGSNNHQTMMREPNALTAPPPPTCYRSLCLP